MTHSPTVRILSEDQSCKVTKLDPSQRVRGEVMCPGRMLEAESFRLGTPERSALHLATFRHTNWAIYAVFALNAHPTVTQQTM